VPIGDHMLCGRLGEDEQGREVDVHDLGVSARQGSRCAKCTKVIHSRTEEERLGGVGEVMGMQGQSHRDTD
jgi:hypothetical protein